jgi:cytochrome c5
LNIFFVGFFYRPVRLHVWAVLTVLSIGTVYGQGSTVDQASSDDYRNILNKYCVSCHNEALNTANLMLDKANIHDLSLHPAIWEKVITKLSLRAMPPVGFPVRPSEDEYDGLFSYLKTGLDQLAAENTNPGSKTIHRLNRTEFSNAVRDMLDLQIDVTSFLPTDNVEDGFDNIAEALSVSPLLMEQYMLAAARISRLAVGPASMLPVSEIYSLPEGYHQDSRTSEELPFGSRGGAAIQHYFPVDGEYTVRVRLDRNVAGYIRGMQKENLLDVRLDHKRLELFKIGGEIHGRTGPIFTDSNNVDFSGDDDQVGYEFSADKDTEVRFFAKAGTRLIGVTFMDDSVKQPGFPHPKLRLTDIGDYKAGNPTILNVVVTGPFNVKGPGETPSRKKIFTCNPTAAEDESCATTILTNLARLAYRRTVTADETDSLLRLYRKGRDSDGFEGGIELALQGIMTSPQFLFRIEQEPEGLAEGAIYPVSDIDLASRLSFFLWSSIPDDELLTLAESGKLRKPVILREQVQRMMADTRFDAFIDNFGSQWLGIRAIDVVQPQLEIFPVFDGELRDAMKMEMILWFQNMVREDRSVMDVLTSDHSYVNERLANHYQIPGIYGSNYRRVKLDDPLRHGLLGKAGLLTITSFNNRTSPVVRGNWVLENMLDMAPPDPPADAFEPELVEADDSGKILTMRESLEIHRANPVCANCHKMMEPIGLALENFDAIGSFRTRYREADAEVETYGLLFDGSEFQDTIGFKQELLKYSDKFAQTVTQKLLTYALGRGVEYYDKPTIRDITNHAASEDYSWSSLITGIIESTPFQYRRL